MKMTLEQLRERNASYAWGRDGITAADLEKVNGIIERIEQTRTEQPQELDCVEFTNTYGEYYPNAIIASDFYRNGGFTVCESGTAYAFIDNDNTPRGDISGGAFPQVDKSKLRYIGKRERTFWVFSTLGAVAQQGLYFSAFVSVFELNERAEDMRKYTTKDYMRVFVHELREPDDYGYKYTVKKSGCISWHAFRTAEELHAFLNRYEAVRESDTDIYWLLQEENISVWTQEEFDAIENAEITSELFNGRKVPHKYVKKGTSLLRYILRADEQRYTA